MCDFVLRCAQSRAAVAREKTECNEERSSCSPSRRSLPPRSWPRPPAGGHAASSAGPPTKGSPPGLDKASRRKTEARGTGFSTSPASPESGVALNGAGRPVIRIYKEKQDVADLPGRARRCARRLRDDGNHRAARSFSEVTASHALCRSASPRASRESATGTLGARVTDGTERLRALEQPRLRRDQHREHRRRSSSRGTSTAAAIRTTASARSTPSRRSISQRAEPTRWSGDGADVDGERRNVDSCRRLRHAEPDDGRGVPRPGGAEVRTHDRASTREPSRAQHDGRRLLLHPLQFCLEDARFVDQIAITPDAFSAGGDSGSLIVTQGGNQPVALLFAGGDGPDDRQSHRPRAAAVRRHDRRFASSPTARRAPRPLWPPLRGTRAPLSPGTRPPSTGGSPITG